MTSLPVDSDRSIPGAVFSARASTPPCGPKLPAALTKDPDKRFQLRCIAPELAASTCYPTAVPVTDDFREFVLEQLGRVVAIDWKRMFGGVGLYADGTFFALIDDDVVFFKVGDQNRADFEAAGARAFSPYGDGVYSMNYYEVPVEVLEDVDALRVWTEKSLAVARSAAAKKGKKKSRR